MLKEQKVIVFTEYIATQHYLQWFLQNHGISSVLYNGKFSKSKKEWMIEIFKQHAQVLIATDAGSEGINLQFCHNIINYDLPWNPLKLEDRKSTRLNSSHVAISYAVFCLKKKKVT